MNVQNRSQKAFIAVTLVTVLSIVSVLTVYAVLLGVFEGNEVTIGGMGLGYVEYTSDNSSWTRIFNATPGADWFARLNITAGGYSGPVTLTWQLQNKTDGWNNVTGAERVTTIVLDRTSEQIVYATSNGIQGESNYNWGSITTTAGAYRVKVFVNSA